MFENNGRVGKSSLLRQFVSHRFTDEYSKTIGADFLPKEVVLNEMKMTLQLWDTAGAEGFESLGRSFYRMAEAIMLVFDLNDAKSFEH